MLFKICQEVLKKYPQTEIGYLIAEIDVKKTYDYTQMLKDCLSNVLIENNLNSQNYALNPQISGWRSVFKDFGISNKSSQKSSVEALLKRIVSGSKMWSVSNAVDVYNCFSVLSLIPMGAYDLEKIKGDIVVRYGKKGELFEPLGSSDNVTVDDKHVIYSDDEKVLCWLWNYRDSKHSSLGDTTKKAIYLLDTAFTMNHMTMKEAVQSFGECLTKIGSKVMSTGILSKENPQTELNLENLCEVSIEKSGLIEDLIEKKRKMYPAEATKVDVVLHDSKAKTNVKKKSVENGNLPDNNAVKPITFTSNKTSKTADRFLKFREHSLENERENNSLCLNDMLFSLFDKAIQAEFSDLPDAAVLITTSKMADYQCNSAMSIANVKNNFKYFYL
jgi:lysyl-tRNA synthetase class 2